MKPLTDVQLMFAAEQFAELAARTHAEPVDRYGPLLRMIANKLHARGQHYKAKMFEDMAKVYDR